MSLNFSLKLHVFVNQNDFDNQMIEQSFFKAVNITEANCNVLFNEFKIADKFLQNKTFI